MNDLEKKFEQAIEDAEFNLLEIRGFQFKPKLALIAGVAIGYKLALKQEEEGRQNENKNRENY